MKFPRRGTYTGRLAFDPESCFHVDPEGRKLVSMDDGKTWRYARRSDTSHNFRYQRNAVIVDSTANNPEPEPHHYEVQPHDIHYEGVKFHPDSIAGTVTSHTEAYQ